MRLFVAINYPEAILDRLEKVCLNLRKCSNGGNFTKRNNLHLTLVFLGEVSRDRIDDIVLSMQESAQGAFEMEVSGFGTFRNSEVCWLGMEKCDKLMLTQEKLAERLRKRGFEIEKREFTPHVTIGRRVELRDDFDRKRFSEHVGKISVPVNTISLMRSDRTDKGIRYSEIDKVIL